jgi:hypothetical protein
MHYFYNILLLFLLIDSDLVQLCTQSESINRERREYHSGVL